VERPRPDHSLWKESRDHDHVPDVEREGDLRSPAPGGVSLAAQRVQRCRHVHRVLEVWGGGDVLMWRIPSEPTPASRMVGSLLVVSALLLLMGVAGWIEGW
jgi:hypothetical protein